MAAAAILFLMDSSQKLIGSSEIPREQHYQIGKQRFVIHPSVAPVMAGANIWEELLYDISHICEIQTKFISSS